MVRILKVAKVIFEFMRTNDRGKKLLLLYFGTRFDEIVDYETNDSNPSASSALPNPTFH